MPFCNSAQVARTQSSRLWQAVHHLDRPLIAFAPFHPAYPNAPALRPTFCVWEHGIVAHEAQAGPRYLASERSEPDFALWQSDCLCATV